MLHTAPTHRKSKLMTKLFSVTSQRSCNLAQDKPSNVRLSSCASPASLPGSVRNARQGQTAQPTRGQVCAAQ